MARGRVRKVEQDMVGADLICTPSSRPQRSKHASFS